MPAVPIVASVVTQEHAQANGMRYVRELHTWSDGTATTVEYGPVNTTGLDLQALATARAVRIAEGAAEAECDAVTEAGPFALKYQSAGEFGARFWRRVQQAQGQDRLRFARLVWWLIERINAGDITDAGARASYNAAFGRALTLPEWAALKATRLTPIHDRYAALDAEGSL